VGFDTVYAFGSFEGALQKLIHLFKYSKVESLAKPLSELLLRALPRDGNFDLVMAMPMHWRKQWDRGFNQAELLAGPVARRLGLKLSKNLRRSRYTQAQAGLDEAGRRANLKGSFRVKQPSAVAGKRILLIDDVLTTGATLRTAAEALKQAGAARVTVLTLARVDRHSGLGNSVLSPKAQPTRAVLAGTEAS
jgi:ComF family protein